MFQSQATSASNFLPRVWTSIYLSCLLYIFWISLLFLILTPSPNKHIQSQNRKSHKKKPTGQINPHRWNKDCFASLYNWAVWWVTRAVVSWCVWCPVIALQTKVLDRGDVWGPFYLAAVSWGNCVHATAKSAAILVLFGQYFSCNTQLVVFLLPGVCCLASEYFFCFPFLLPC